MSTLDGKIPGGPISEKWTNYKNKVDLVNPANKRNIDVIVVGTGLAGSGFIRTNKSPSRTKSPSCTANSIISPDTSGLIITSTSG